MIESRDKEDKPIVSLKKAEGGCSYPGPLLQLGHHDNDGAPLLPDHPPEFAKRLRQSSLGGDVGVLLPVAIDIVGIDVVASGDTCK